MVFDPSACQFVQEEQAEGKSNKNAGKVVLLDNTICASFSLL